MTRPSERELRRAVESLSDDDGALSAGEAYSLLVKVASGDKAPSDRERTLLAQYDDLGALVGGDR